MEQRSNWGQLLNCWEQLKGDFLCEMEEMQQFIICWRLIDELHEMASPKNVSILVCTIKPTMSLFVLIFNIFHIWSYSLKRLTCHRFFRTALNTCYTRASISPHAIILISIFIIIIIEKHFETDKIGCKLQYNNENNQPIFDKSKLFHEMIFINVLHLPLYSSSL